MARLDRAALRVSNRKTASRSPCTCSVGNIPFHGRGSTGFGIGDRAGLSLQQHARCGVTRDLNPASPTHQKVQRRMKRRARCCLRTTHHAPHIPYLGRKCHNFVGAASKTKEQLRSPPSAGKLCCPRTDKWRDCCVSLGLSLVTATDQPPRRSNKGGLWEYTLAGNQPHSHRWKKPSVDLVG